MSPKKLLRVVDPIAAEAEDIRGCLQCAQDLLETLAKNDAKLTVPMTLLGFARINQFSKLEWDMQHKTVGRHEVEHYLLEEDDLRVIVAVIWNWKTHIVSVRTTSKDTTSVASKAIAKREDIATYVMMELTRNGVLRNTKIAGEA